MGSPSYDDIQAGTEIAPRQYQVTRRDLVRYAGASGDFNVIHWNERIAKSVGLPDVIAHGMLTMALAGRFLTEWAGDPGAVAEYGVRVSAPVVVHDDDKGATVEVTGTVTEKLDGRRVAIDVTARSEGTKVLPRAAAGAGEPVLILGGGSNLVIADAGFDGTVVQVATRGLARDGQPGTVTVAAGEDWDEGGARTLAEGLAGLECLSGIPGRAGATPIQNVGAYGQEVSQVITEVRVYDRLTKETLYLPNESCGFGYRTSMFKRDDAHRLDRKSVV